MTRALRRASVAADTATIARGPGTFAPMPAANNRGNLANILVRALAVEQKIDTADQQINELLGRLNDIP